MSLKKGWCCKLADAAEADKKYAEIVRSRYTKAKNLMMSRFDAVEVNRNLYKGYLNTDDNYEWDYSLVDQQVFPLIRNYIARSNPSMTKIRLEARKPEDFEKRQVNQDFINWEISELDLTTLLTRGFFSNYVAGKGYYKTGWKYDARVVIENGEYKYEMKPLTNRAELKFVPFNHILVPNRNIPDLMEQPYIFELMQIRVGDMIKDNETYGYEYWDKKFIAKLREEGVTGKLLDYEADFVKDSDTKDEMTFQSATFPAVCMHTKEGELIYIPLSGDTTTIINVNRKNPYWHGHYPFIDMTAFPEDDEFLSMSVVDAVGDLQIASTEILNQGLTNIRSINNEMWISGASAAGTPDYMFKKRPDGIIRVAGDPNQITQVRQTDNTRSILAMGQEVSNKFERTGGISSLYSSGAGSDQINQTARGAQIIDKNIETNVQMILDLFGEQVLKRIGDHFQELNAQYVTEEQTFSITGKKGVRELITINQSQVSANFDVYTYPEAMIKQTPASRQASLQNLLTVINTQVVPGGTQVDIVPLVENLIDSYPEMENIDDIVTSLDEKGERDCLMLSRGQMPEVKVKDNHKELVMFSSVWFEEHMAELTPETIDLFTKYAEKHIRFVQAAQQTQQMINPPQPTMPGGPGGGVDMGGGPVPDVAGTGQTPGYNLNSIIAKGGQNG